MEQFQQIAIHGVGLMGASLGLAAKRCGAAQRIVGVGRDIALLERARGLGCIDRTSTDLATVLKDSDLIVLCTPVRHILSALREVAQTAPADAIVTDVGSVKASLVSEAEKHFTGPSHFLGSHPIAGSEKSGAEFAREDLFDNACCFLTPTVNSAPETVERLRWFWQMLGCRITITSPERHDALMAAVSHAPHLTAVALVEALKRLGEQQETINEVSGKGLRDATRLALGPSAVWRDICLENRQELLKALDAVGDSLQRLRRAVDDGDGPALMEILEAAAQDRAHLDNS